MRILDKGEFSSWSPCNSLRERNLAKNLVWHGATFELLPCQIRVARQILSNLRVRFQDWILKSEKIRKRTLRFFTGQINPRSLKSWCVKGTEESILKVDSPLPLTHHDPNDLGLICVVKKCKIRFRILSDLTIRTRFKRSIFLDYSHT